jgi:hypothetical protein
VAPRLGVLFACFALWLPPCSAAGPISAVQLACAPERAALTVGGTLVLHAWATDSDGKPLPGVVRTVWTVSAGVVAGSEPATWRLPAVPGRAMARVEIGVDTKGHAVCELAVEVTPPSPPPPEVPVRGQIAARALLVRGTSEPAGFGLYSYLLIDAPPADARERQRQLSAVESYLREIESLEALADLRPPSQLNLTMLPVESDIPLPARLDDPAVLGRAAAAVLAGYDYARAKHLLDVLGEPAPRGTIALVSRRAPASAAGVTSLVMNMSVVSPALLTDWLRAFCWLSSQERSWSDAALVRLGLGTRNAVAVAAAHLGEALVEWPRLMHTVTPR